MEGIAVIRGIDASWHQKEIDIASLARQADYAVFRATDGINEDVTFNGTGTVDGIRRFLFRDARDAGLIVGAYHYLRSGSVNGAEQALIFVRALKRANNGHCDGALCVLFVEHDIKRGSIPTGNDVRSFIEAFQMLVPMQPLFVATNANLWATHIKVDLQRFENVYVWLERWSDVSGPVDTVTPMVPREWWDMDIGGRKPTMIQFTAQARIGDTRVQASLYRDDRMSLARLAEVAIPFTVRTSKPSLPKRILTPTYRPKRASDTDDRRRSGRTTLLTVGAVGGILVIMGAAGYVAWMSGKDATEPIFDRGW